MKSIASPVSLAERRPPADEGGPGGDAATDTRTQAGTEAPHTGSGHHHVDLHVTSHATGERHVLHDVLDLLGLLLVGVLAWALWPASLGGSTHIIVVQGHSMEPVFHLGDAIVVKENHDPQVGDIIVYRVPEGEPGAGSMVVHRIVAFRSDGSIQTRGDNREVADPFEIRQEDILGTPAWTLPHVGRMIGLASNPLVVGICIGLIALLMLLPGRENKEAEPAERATDPEDVVSPDAHPGDGAHDSPARISPVVAARVRSLQEPQQLSLADLGDAEFDELLASLGPDA